MAKDGPRTYTAKQREEALALYVEHGPAEASRRCGIPSTTIRQWGKRSGKTSPRADRAAAGAVAARLTWAARKAEVAQRSGEAAAEFLERAIGDR
jgi:transposase-like protein